MKDRFLPAALFLSIALARPLSAASPNLLTNGSFDHDLAGWSHAPNATWSFALGGTVLVFTSPTPGSEVLSQCVGVEGGSLYTVSAALVVPEERTLDATLDRAMDALELPDGDRYLVSNINGAPPAKDNNGFISRMAPDGTIEQLRFIAGGTGGATLHAPRGMIIVGDTLWAESEILEKRESKSNPDVGIVTMRCRGINQRREVVVEYRRTFMVYKRTAPQAARSFPGTDEEWRV